ncbi:MULTISPECIES: hypothetical protein [unclassified Ornithinimicrobium]|uniref:hypothetical protein n=1 Tax=unclassified Ornithinimicrobium TaxID=2615080 RepID=UPI003852ECD1
MGDGEGRGRVTSTQWGLVAGLLIGAAVGVVLFALTNEVLWLVLPGVGVALGSGIGASLDSRRR